MNIKPEKLKDGFLYELEARNQNRGIWRADVGGFEIARTKFDNKFLFIEYEWSLGLNGDIRFGTAKAFREIEQVPEGLFNDDAARLKYLESFNGTPTIHQCVRYANDDEYRKDVDRFGFDLY